MEVNSREVPLYGQVEGHVKLQAAAPQDADFYVAVQGSELTHIMTAKRGDDSLTLCFTVPGHGHIEDVSVTSCVYTEDTVRPCEGETSLKYLRDVAQEAAEYLRANRHQLGPQSYLEVLKRFSTSAQVADEEFSPGGFDHNETDKTLMQRSGDGGFLRQLDEKMVEAMANMDYLQRWKNKDNHSGEDDLQPKETLLHLAVRLGLVHLAHFLIHQPRGHRLLTLPNQDGDTPLQLAQRDEQHDMFRMLAGPPDPTVCPVPAVHCICSDSSCMLRFHPRTNSLTLTVRNSPCPQDGIMILRERLRDPSILKLISELKAENKEDKCKDEILLTDEGIREELRVEAPALGENVFEEQLVLSLDDDDEEEEYASSLPVNGTSMPSSRVEDQFNHKASDLQPSMINSSEETITQPEDVDFKFSIGGVTSDSTGTDGVLWDTVDSEDLHPATDTPPPHSEGFQPPYLPESLLLSPADQALARLNRPLFSETTNQRESPPMDTCDLSLVALELDSEEESPEPKPLLPPLLSNVDKSDDKIETCRPSPNLACTRTQSASSASETPTKDMGDLGIRLRSYSYSSPKISLRPSRLNRENHTSDVSSEQRTPTMSEQCHEKRDVNFRRRTQSADDDEGGVELTESLQHLTLSEFLKEYV